MLDTTTCDRLLDRIGLSHVPAPDSAGLYEVHRAFVSSIPYEDLAIHLGEFRPLNVRHLIERVMTGGRGGYCFEANTVLRALLITLGFTVISHQSVVGPRDASPAAPAGSQTNHLALIATTADGDEYIVDGGLGDGPLNPLALVPGPVQSGAFTYTIERYNEGWWVKHHEHGGFDGFRFEDNEATLEDFQPHHLRLSTSPASTFVQTLVVQLPADDRIVTLRARTLFFDGPGIRDRRLLGDQPEFTEALARQFGIELRPDELSRLWAVACLQHDAYQAVLEPVQ